MNNTQEPKIDLNSGKGKAGKSVSHNGAATHFDNIQDTASALSNTVTETVDEIATRMKEGAKDVGQKVQEYATMSSAFIRRNPVLFLLVAVGVLAIWFLSREKEA